MTLRGPEITVDTAASRAQGLMQHLDNGPGNALLQVFADAERPEFGASSALPTLVELPLAKPCGEIVDGGLRLHMRDAAGAMIMSTGAATWARLLTAAGTLSMDLDVSVEGGEGQVQIPGSAQLLAGGYMTLAATSVIE